MKSLIALLFLQLLMINLASAESPPEPLPRLILIGDSTVRVGTGGQRGWGEEFAPFFNGERFEVRNRAIGGRSSRTFRTEGRWATILDTLAPGDVVIMQFGHNDGGLINDEKRARGSLQGIGEETREINNLMTGSHEVVHTYGWYLRQYIREAEMKGATMIVCSPVARKIWKEGKIVRDRYAPWARAVARQEGALFLDLNEITSRAYEELGPDAVEPFFADERTHTTVAGARFNAERVIAGLKALEDNPLKDYFSEAAVAIDPYAP